MASGHPLVPLPDPDKPRNCWVDRWAGFPPDLAVAIMVEARREGIHPNEMLVKMARGYLAIARMGRGRGPVVRKDDPAVQARIRDARSGAIKRSRLTRTPEKPALDHPDLAYEEPA